MVRVRKKFIKQDIESTKKKINKVYYIRMRTPVQRYLKENGKTGYILKKIYTYWQKISIENI